MSPLLLPPTILVVDGNANLRAIAGRAFEGLGCIVFDASDGQSSLERLRWHPEVALLFADLRMSGMSGLDLAKRARALRPALKIVLTSLEPVEEVPHGSAFVPKPWRIAELEAIVAPLRRSVRREKDTAKWSWSSGRREVAY